MSKELKTIVSNFRDVATQDLMSITSLRDELKKNLNVSPTLPTLISWTKNTHAPYITNLAKILSPKIRSAIYYYPEVEYMVRNYYLNTKAQGRVGRKKMQ